MSVQCFFLEPIDRARVALRRLSFFTTASSPCSVTHLSTSDKTDRCPLPGGYHDAQTPIGECGARVSTGREARDRLWQIDAPDVPRDDPRWPSACGCGYVFEPDDEWQVFMKPLYRRVDTGEETTLQDAGPGAMWDAWWMSDWYKGPDGHCLVVKCPNGREWMIDGRASNCDSPCAQCGQPYHVCLGRAPCTGYQDARPHKCWIRHGTPPNLTVDKQGVTCGAGAGSIIAGDYHGCLVNGRFTP